MADTKGGSAKKSQAAAPARDRKGLSRRHRHVTKPWPAGYHKTTPERPQSATVNS